MEAFRQRLSFRQRKQQDGFTLVELMVVVAVIAILASLAMPQFLNASNKAKEAKIKSDVTTISNAAQLYMMEQSTDTVPTVETLYKEGYLTEHVTTPKGGEYTVTSVQNEGGKGKHIAVTAPDAAN